jgi:hypothetical protein
MVIFKLFLGTLSKATTRGDLALGWGQEEERKNQLASHPGLL